MKRPPQSLPRYLSPLEKTGKRFYLGYVPEISDPEKLKADVTHADHTYCGGFAADFLQQRLCPNFPHKIFGVAALLYLGVEELLGEAHKKEDNVWISATFFNIKAPGFIK